MQQCTKFIMYKNYKLTSCYVTTYKNITEENGRTLL